MRRAAALIAAPAAALLALPATASAHGIVQREDLPIPHVVFAWAVAGVLVVSFVALGALWPRPRLEDPAWRALPAGRVLGSRAWDVVLGSAGVLLLAVVLGAGWIAGGTALDNLAPTFILITFWVGLAFASVLFGDVFALLSPWRALGRGTGWLVHGVLRRPVRHAAYPERLGRYPAVAVLLIFGWIELVSGWGDAPATLASAAAGYTVITLAGQAVFGVEAWTRRAEGFAVYYNLLSRISIWERRARVLGVRPPLAGLPRMERPVGTVAFVLTMIGTVTFDGLGQGPAWASLRGVLVDGFTAVGISAEAAPKWASTVGLVACVALIAGFYRLGISGARSVGGKLGEAELRVAFIHTLVPIAAVYIFAHYFSFLLFEGQGVIYLASDPFGQGWDLFGTASTGIDYSLISQTGTWYVQVAFVCVGHVSALVLAHDRALALYDDVKLAVRSQYWMLGVMVGFTSLALWLLAQASA
ncbi:MAG TPA: fenitrothion hydrolase [Solirubrobacteraceae bacterium]|nr:fenitrothion hydrolase [Solirubrobacteraceae bacterium]